MKKRNVAAWLKSKSRSSRTKAGVALNIIAVGLVGSMPVFAEGETIATQIALAQTTGTTNVTLASVAIVSIVAIVTGVSILLGLLRK